ncbi:MAG: hypothetical protein PHT69_02735 [Bacteroidales bacterium]|nr:hypothetical protein [Bacteroidales bacterium]
MEKINKIKIVSESVFCGGLQRGVYKQEIMLHKDYSYLLPEIESCIEKITYSTNYKNLHKEIPMLVNISCTNMILHQTSIGIVGQELIEPILIVPHQLLSTDEIEILANLLSDRIIRKLPVKKLAQIEKQKKVYRVTKSEPYLGFTEYTVYLDELLSKTQENTEKKIAGSIAIFGLIGFLTSGIVTASIVSYVMAAIFALILIVMLMLNGVLIDDTNHPRYTEIYSIKTSSEQEATTEINCFIKTDKDKHTLKLILEELKNTKNVSSWEM